MFDDCSSLTSLNLTSFNTSLVESMEGMFYHCYFLTSLNLSNFNTSLVKYMDFMFCQCLSLTSLDLSNFNISSIINMHFMFENCRNIEYINFPIFSKVKFIHIFDNVPDNVVICINNITNIEIFYDITNIKCLTIDCSNDWKSKQKKIINNTNQCIESCDKSELYQFDYNGKCYENCVNGILKNDNDNLTKICKCELDKCLLCPQVALDKNLCTKCNINYYPRENAPLNLGEYINCYNESEGYYLDNYLFKKCYKTCKTCNAEGNHTFHNCIRCLDDFSFVIKKNENMNCYKNCSYYYYFDNENNFHCTKNLSCPKEYPKLIENRLECIEYVDLQNLMKGILNKEINKTEKSREEEIEYYDNILTSIESGFTSENYDTSNIDNGKDEVIKTEKLIITFTTSQNQKNNINNNMTTIDLGECELLLRNFYNISNNETLYMKKIDVIQEETKALKVEYDVYCKLSGTNLIKLNLTVCGKSKISISIPIVINEHLDKLNTSSGYYNDICYTTTSEDGTDISLKDRQTEYIDKDKIVCQEGCDFSHYDYETYIAKCSCKVKESSSSIADMNIDKAKLLKNFKEIKNIINFDFLICYKKLFNKEGIRNNIGCIIIFIIIFFHIISIFIFSINNFHLIKKKIEKIAT